MRVLVVGAAGGIGAEVCHDLLDSGARVIAADANVDALSSLEEDLSTRNVPALSETVTVDVTDQSSTRTLAELVAKSWTGLDGVVNLAGVGGDKRLRDLQEDVWNSVLDVSLGGTYRVVRHVHELLANGIDPAVVNTSSIVANLALPWRTAYAASKSGVDAVTRSLAAELAPEGIRVNAVAPGYVRTPLLESALASGSVSEDRIVERTLLGRMATPADIAPVIRFLLSPSANYITGQTLVVDGGFTVSGK